MKKIIKIKNKIENKIENNFNQLTLEFNVKYIGEFSSLIKLIESCKNLEIQIETNNLIIVENNNKIKLNLIDLNEKDNNSSADGIIMVYNINGEKGLEEIKLLFEQKLKEINEANLIYLIGIETDSNKDNIKHKEIYFFERRITAFLFFLLKTKEKNIKTFINNLLEELKKEKL